MALVPFMRRDIIPNDGSVVDLPEPVHAEGHEPAETWTPDNELLPTIIYRKDIGEWQTPEVGSIRELVNDPRLQDDWELWPTPLGNFAITRRVPERDGSYGDAYYVGYIDLVLGEIVLFEGESERLQDIANNYPFTGPLRTVLEVGHAQTLQAFRGKA